jgi:hypothetical protein
LVTLEISPIFRRILKKPTDTGIPVWFALEDRLRRIEVIK